MPSGATASLPYCLSQIFSQFTFLGNQHTGQWLPLLHQSMNPQIGAVEKYAQITRRGAVMRQHQQRKQAAQQSRLTAKSCRINLRSEERRVGKECKARCRPDN